MRNIEKSKPQTNPYVIKFMKCMQWRPGLVSVFAGNQDYKRYSFTDRLMIRLIILITKGPTDSKIEIEYTNWEQVNEFGRELVEM